MAILTVVPGQSIEDAVAAANPGDTVDVQAGIYTNDFVSINQRHATQHRALRCNTEVHRWSGYRRHQGTDDNDAGIAATPSIQCPYPNMLVAPTLPSSWQLTCA